MFHNSLDLIKLITTELPPQPLLEVLARELHHRLVKLIFNGIWLHLFSAVRSIWLHAWDRIFLLILSRVFIILGTSIVQYRYDPPERVQRSVLHYWHQLLPWLVSINFCAVDIVEHAQLTRSRFTLLHNSNTIHCVRLFSWHLHHHRFIASILYQVVSASYWLLLSLLHSVFAGYGKMPEYEHMFTDFLLNLRAKQV